MKYDSPDAPKDTLITEMTVEDIRTELKDWGVSVHHKTGIDNLISTLTKVRAGTYEASAKKEVVTVPNVPSAAATAAMLKATTQTKTQKAMTLQRIIVTPNDPLLSAQEGMIFTVGSSSVNNGRMVKKYVPFNNEEGWHVPQIIINQIKNAEMQKSKSVKTPNGEMVNQPFISKRFNVQILDPLTREEMTALAASQQAKGGMQV